MQDAESAGGPPVAADGGRMPPAASTFGQFVGFLEDGELDAELTLALKEIAADMHDAAIESGGKSKGKLTLTLDFTLEGRVYTIKAKHKIDVPEPKRPPSVLWTTEDNRFTPRNPAQGQLFGVREVRGSAGFRDA